MTNFIKMPPIDREVKETKEPKKTVFKSVVNTEREIVDTMLTPRNFDNVLHIGKGMYYGDVFKCWNSTSDVFYIFIGTAGDEFK